MRIKTNKYSILRAKWTKKLMKEGEIGSRGIFPFSITKYIKN